MSVAFPKPVRREKKRKQLQRKPIGPRTYDEATASARLKKLRARVMWRLGAALPVTPAPAGTKHSRREREWGRMAYERANGCDVRMAFYAAQIAGELEGDDPGPCRRGTQYMHLHIGKNAGRRRAPDDSGAGGCEGHHQDIDGRIGGKAPWYVGLGYDGQQALKRRLVTRQRARWDALTPAQQAYWNDVGRPRGR